MRKIARVDQNQSEIIDALRKCGASIQSLAQIGAGCPDLLIGYRGHNYLAEVKDGKKPPSERALTAAQLDWHAQWRGNDVMIFESIAAVLYFIDHG